MPRIRTVKPEFWEDETVGTISRDARLMFLATLNLADDEGLLRWSAAYIKASAFMYDDDVHVGYVENLMRELVDARLVFPYRGGKAQQRLAFIVGFRKHQKINRPQATKLPTPSAHDPLVTVMYAERDRWTCHRCHKQVPKSYVSDDLTPEVAPLHARHRGSTAPSLLTTFHSGCVTAHAAAAHDTDPDLFAGLAPDPGGDTHPDDDATAAWTSVATPFPFRTPATEHVGTVAFLRTPHPAPDPVQPRDVAHPSAIVGPSTGPDTTADPGTVTGSDTTVDPAADGRHTEEGDDMGVFDDDTVDPFTAPTPTPTATATKRRARTAAAVPEQYAADVQALCDRLEGHVQRNFSPAQRATIKIDARWRKEAHLLLAKDGYDRAQVEAVIDWACTDDFWRSNIRTMHGLRKHIGAITLRREFLDWARRHQRPVAAAGHVTRLQPTGTTGGRPAMLAAVDTAHKPKGVYGEAI